MFRDPHTGVECDISIHNALALRNTRLLRVYSMIDPRVRWLAPAPWAGLSAAGKPQGNELS